MSKEDLLRQLQPKSVHFDGYNLVGLKVRGSPFFSEHTIHLGEYSLMIRHSTENEVQLEFQSVCPRGYIKFEPYRLTFNSFVSKLKEAVSADCDFIYFEIKPNISISGYCSYCEDNNRDCVEFRRNIHNTVMAAVSFDLEDVQMALSEYHGIISTKKNGGTDMRKKNNFFGMKFEFGLSKDPNLASTLLGVAVKDNQGTWWSFDPVKKVHKNLASVKLGSFPIFLLPATTVNPGDMIKREGKYFWVTEVTPSGSFKAIGALDGMVNEILPTETLVPGFNMYTKVVAMDMHSLTDQSGNGVANNLLSAILLMQWSKNDSKAEFTLDDMGEDSFNGMGALLPLVLAQSGTDGNIFNALGDGSGGSNLIYTMMMLGSGDSDDSSDFTQMLLLSRLLNNGGNTGLEGIIPGLGSTQQKMEPKSAVENMVECKKCGRTWSADNNFCPMCGEKTVPIGKKLCKKCGAELMEGALYCHKCGQYNGALVCSGCNTELPDGAAFCHKCGMKVEDVTSDNATTEDQKKTSE